MESADVGTGAASGTSEEVGLGADSGVLDEDEVVVLVLVVAGPELGTRAVEWEVEVEVEAMTLVLVSSPRTVFEFVIVLSVLNVPPAPRQTSPCGIGAESVPPPERSS